MCPCKRGKSIQTRISEVDKLLHVEFYDQMLSIDDQAMEVRSAKQTQKVDNGIEAQRNVLAIPPGEWARLYLVMVEKGGLTPMEIGILKKAMQMPAKLPTEKQCRILLVILDKARLEGVLIGG